MGESCLKILMERKLVGNHILATKKTELGINGFIFAMREFN
jgi:hypothetical protein